MSLQVLGIFFSNNESHYPPESRYSFLRFYILLMDYYRPGKGGKRQAFAGCQIISLIFHVFRVIVPTFRHLMFSYVHGSVKPCTYPSTMPATVSKRRNDNTDNTNISENKTRLGTSTIFGFWASQKHCP